MCGGASYMGQTFNPNLRVENMDVLKIYYDADDDDDEVASLSPGSVEYISYPCS